MQTQVEAEPEAGADQDEDAKQVPASDAAVRDRAVSGAAHLG
jgi:hypothetical protein